MQTLSDLPDLSALGDHVLIQLQPPARSAGGILLPAREAGVQERRTREGLLVSVGPGAPDDARAAIGKRVWFVRRSARDMAAQAKLNRKRRELGLAPEQPGEEDTFRVRGGAVYVKVPAHNLLAAL